MTATNQDLRAAIKPGYDSEWGKPNFLDSHGQPVAGIYADVENEDYHAIPALSSSKLKKFSQSPALYYREYVSKLKRAKAASTANAFTAGSVTHGLVLEPERCDDLFWYHLNPIDFPHSLHTASQLKEELERQGIKPKGTVKAHYIDQLLAHDPAYADKIFDVQARNHLLARFRDTKQPWASASKAIYPEALLTLADYQAYYKKLNTLPVSDDLDEMAAQLLAVSPTLMTHTNIDKLHETKVFELKACEDYMREYVLDPITYGDAHRARHTVRSHVRANSLLQDGIAELTMIAQDTETGLWIKAKFDWLRYDLISVDLKTTRDTHPDRFMYQCRDLGYDLQDAFYCHVAKLLGFPIQSFTFVTVEFADMDNCEVFEFSERVRSRAMNNRRRLMQELQYCQARNQWYGYNPNQSTMVLDW